MRPAAGHRAVRWTTGLAVAALVVGLSGCDAGSSTPGSAEPAASASRDGESPRESPGAPEQDRGPRTTIEAAPGPLEALPDVPSAGDARALADQIVVVETVIRDPRARPEALRRAGEFEQLAGRLLALGDDAFAEQVLGMLPPDVRAKTHAHLEAAALLDGMSGPVPEFPDWRIVEPPPARVLLDHYRSAGRRVGVPWQYLAAVHLVETRMGRIRGVSTAGAQGPMQFLPTTWDIYGEGGDIDDPEDAILAAARLLRANGAPGDMSEALWHYNPSDSYVGAVTRYAQQIERSPSAYAGYWHWRVIYKHVDGPAVLEVGYPNIRPQRLD